MVDFDIGELLFDGVLLFLLSFEEDFFVDEGGSHGAEEWAEEEDDQVGVEGAADDAGSERTGGVDASTGHISDGEDAKSHHHADSNGVNAFGGSFVEVETHDGDLEQEGGHELSPEARADVPGVRGRQAETLDLLQFFEHLVGSLDVDHGAGDQSSEQLEDPVADSSAESQFLHVEHGNGGAGVVVAA